MTNWKIAGILFLEGFISLSAEIIAIRQITIFGGNIVTVTSIIIGIFLSALALGYMYGKNAQNVRNKLVTNFLLAGTCIGFGLSLGAQMYLFSFFESRWLYVVFASILTVAPIGFLLSQTLPLLTSMMRDASASQASSKVLYLSTIGSFIGAVVTPIVLMQTIGVSLTIAFIALLAIGCSLLLVSPSLVRGAGSVLAAGIILIINYSTSSLNSNQILIVSENAYATTLVESDDEYRRLMINFNNSSRVFKEGNGGEHLYIQAMQKEIRLHASLTNNNSLKILVIGAGGFSMSGSDSKHAFTFIDPNPDLKRVSENYFLKRKIKGELIVDDAFHWAHNDNDSEDFDVIILDAYKSKISVPVQLMTKEFFNDLRTHLSSNGILMINFIQEYPASQFDVNVDATIAASFPMCTSYYPDIKRVGLNNILYVCEPSAGSVNRIGSIDLPLIQD